jgi:hypothetical protein
VLADDVRHERALGIRGTGEEGLVAAAVEDRSGLSLIPPSTATNVRTPSTRFIVPTV